MPFTSATVIHRFLNADGTPASGSIEFTLQQAMTNGSVTMVPGTHVTAQLDASGNLSQTLTSTEDAGTWSQGLAQWRADERVVGAPGRTMYVQVPSGGVTVDYAAIVQVGQSYG